MNAKILSRDNIFVLLEKKNTSSDAHTNYALNWLLKANILNKNNFSLIMEKVETRYMRNLVEGLESLIYKDLLSEVNFRLLVDKVEYAKDMSNFLCELKPYLPKPKNITTDDHPLFGSSSRKSIKKEIRSAAVVNILKLIHGDDARLSDEHIKVLRQDDDLDNVLTVYAHLLPKTFFDAEKISENRERRDQGPQLTS